MPDYKKMYFKLAGSVADAIDLLIKAQKDGEDAYVNTPDSPIEIVGINLKDNKKE